LVCDIKGEEVLRIFGPKRDDVKGGWRELHNLYSSPGIIRKIITRRMRWTGHVAGMGERGIHIGYWWESQKESYHWKGQDIIGLTILK
jgi:hypothetical protein